jgi:sugar transferase (PEP-CTERM/EpsH1 system associated)
MKILFLAPRLPLPADTGGKIRTWNILKQLCKHAQVHLVAFAFDKRDEKFKEDIQQQLKITVDLITLNEGNALQKACNVLFKSSPHSVVKYFSPKMTNFLESLKHQQSFNAVHIDHIHMAHYRKIFARCPSMIDEHNVEYKILERCVDVEPSFLKRALFRDQARKMKKFEQEMLLSSTACCAVSSDDKTLLDELTNKKISSYIIPNGVDTKYFHIQKEGTLEEDSIVFTGSMDWLPNDDAAVFFCREVLPLIWKKRPEVKFYIVGRNPSAALNELAKDEKRITVTGRVEDVRDYVWRSKIFVVPIRVGGGTRLKILEAMSMAKTTISTTIGAEGIRHTDGKNIILADTLADLAKTTIELLGNSLQRHAIGEGGRKLVCEQYDWNIIGEDLIKAYHEIVHSA